MSDSFADLWNSLATEPSKQQQQKHAATRTLAERQAAAAREQLGRLENERARKEKEAQAWTGLDLLGGQGSSRSKSVTTTHSTDGTILDVDDWGLSPSTTQPSIQRQQQLKDRPAISQTATSTDLFDFLSDDIANHTPHRNGHDGPSTSVRSSTTTPRTPDSPGDFDFGDRLLGNSEPSDVDDDILGMLGKPVDIVKKHDQDSNARQPSNRPTPPPPPARNTNAASRPISPPPHIIGQIVEMGFSPEQARLALAATDSGVDVQQALDMLLSNGAEGTDASHYDSDTDSMPIRRSRSPGDAGERWPEEPRRPPAATQNKAQHPLHPSSSSSLVSTDLQERADKLLTQASTLGITMFTRANAFWKEGKVRVQKAYEDHAGSSQGGSRVRTPVDGRPRWMVDAQLDENVDEDGSSGRAFRDNEDAETVVHSSPSRRTNNGPASAPARQPSKVVNLFEDEPASYVSPARRKTAGSRTPQVVSDTPPRSSPIPTTQSVSEPLRTRPAVSAPAHTLVLSDKHKAKGTELFKLGQYGEAEAAYTSALDVLPSNHLLLVPLYNNRAVTRLKTGNQTGAIEDCTTVLSIIGLSYHPAKEAKVQKEEEGSTVDLGDAMVKAYKRRAEAYEGKEKWALAQKDWEAIVGCEWARNARQDALGGLSRCRKMVSSEREPESAPPRPKPRAAPPTRQPSPHRTYEAVQKLREANKALEEEEEQRLQLKDGVDARLQAWRTNKETNVRALLASLESVLWPELGWQKVGMHELVTPGQVKMRYTRAIAKLHPDKLNVNNTTLEQRMIANGVFAALNDAWLAFKQ